MRMVHIFQNFKHYANRHGIEELGETKTDQHFSGSDFTPNKVTKRGEQEEKHVNILSCKPILQFSNYLSLYSTLKKCSHDCANVVNKIEFI